MENDTIDLADLIDRMISAAIAAEVPPMPSVIADTLSDVLFREAGPRYAEYHQQVLAAVHERIEVFRKLSA